MQIMKRLVVLIFTALFFSNSALGQEKVEKEVALGNKGWHQLSFMLSHSIIGEGIVNGTKRSISAPSLGFDYNYWVQNKWAIGLQTDIITESFKIEDNGGAVIDRSTPIAIVPAISFKPIDHSMFILGLGKEYAKEGDFTLTRLGYEYSFELPRKYELSLGLTFDKKCEAYNIWTFGIIISKLLE